MKQKMAAEQAAAPAPQAPAPAPKPPPGPAAAPVGEGSRSALRVAPSAVDWESSCRESWERAKKEVEEIDTVRGACSPEHLPVPRPLMPRGHTALGGHPQADQYKKDRRELKKELQKFVLQIAAVESQIDSKAHALVSTLAGKPPLAQKWALLQLAEKIVAQCESQVAEVPTFAFPLAEVAVRVGARLPDFIPLLLAELQSRCPLAVPKCFRPLKKQGQSDEEALEIYRQAYPLLFSAAGTSGGAPAAASRRASRPHFRFACRASMQYVKRSDGAWEDEDTYIRRQQGYLRFLAAVFQSESPQAGRHACSAGLGLRSARPLRP